MSVWLAIFLMFLTLVVSLIPYVPGPALMWLIGIVFAFVDDFERVTMPAVILMTIFMVIGSTTEFWLRALGMQRRGGSCWGFLGSIIGGTVGTMVIPIPILGTLIGAVAGALIVEFMRIGELRHALHAGQSVIEMYVVGILVEFTMSVCILGIFVASVIWTA